MNIWTLPGPAEFLRKVERSLREGMSTVVRFPISEQTGFRDRMLAMLDDSWTCSIFRPEPTRPPFESLCDRFAPSLSREWGTNLLDLCEREDFQGRLIWIDGLEQLSRRDWDAWKKFLVDYAQASRSVQDFHRTLFVTSLEGIPSSDSPVTDVTLTTHDWRCVVDEMDLLFLAYARLRERSVNPTMRSLLAATVARVAVWDLETAERLLDQETDRILEPTETLRSVAHERGWTTETPVGWEFGTDSGNGTLHAALASLPGPPRELRRRLWSAQASVLLPLVDVERYKIVEENYRQLGARLRSAGETMDPLALQIGNLKGLVEHSSFDRNVRNRVERLHRWRNRLAHLEPLSPSAVHSLAGG